jgi:hypothetical protein
MPTVICDFCAKRITPGQEVERFGMYVFHKFDCFLEWHSLRQKADRLRKPEDKKEQSDG